MALLANAHAAALRLQAVVSAAPEYLPKVCSAVTSALSVVILLKLLMKLVTGSMNVAGSCCNLAVKTSVKRASSMAACCMSSAGTGVAVARTVVAPLGLYQHSHVDLLGQQAQVMSHPCHEGPRTSCLTVHDFQ